MPAGVLTEKDKFDAQQKERAVGEAEQVHDRNLGRAIEYAKTHPMVVVAGPAPAPVNGVVRKIKPDDPAFTEKTQGLRKKNESLTAFVARTGVSLHQIVTLSRKDLERLIEIKAQNADDVRDPSKYWRAPAVGSITGAPLRVTFDASGDLDGFYSKGTPLPPNIIEVGN